MSRWQAVYEERPTFETLLGGKGYSLPEAHRKWLALAKDYRLQDTMGASDEELHALDLKIHEARRREQDVRAAAMRQGRELGEVALGNFTNGTAPDMFDSPDRENHWSRTDAEAASAVDKIRQTLAESRRKNLEEIRASLDEISRIEEKHMRTKTYTDSFAEGVGAVGKYTTGAVMGSLGLPFAGASSDLAGWFWEREARSIAELAETMGVSLQHARELYHRHQERVAVELPPTPPNLA